MKRYVRLAVEVLRWGSLTVLMLALTMLIVRELGKAIVPGRWDCPAGSQAYLRWTGDGSDIGYWCFDPSDAKHGDRT